MNIAVKKFSRLSIFFFVIGITTANADSWVWKLESASFLESKISIYSANNKLTTYTIECNLEDALLKEPLEESDSPARIEKMITPKIPHGVLLTTCIVGAHSKNVSVFDPTKNLTDAVFSIVGSYYADWQLVDNELIIYYDRPCETNQLNCELYYRESVAWPTPVN